MLDREEIIKGQGIGKQASRVCVRVCVCVYVPVCVYVCVCCVLCVLSVGCECECRLCVCVECVKQTSVTQPLREIADECTQGTIAFDLALEPTKNFFMICPRVLVGSS